MIFSHIADVHIGGWREPTLRALGILGFEKAISISIEKEVDFVLISGDLFDNAMPAIDLLKDVAGILKRLKDKNIRVYIVAGSHDFSASGKTMIDVFEKAGLVQNVVNFIDNKLKIIYDKSGAKIAGYLGKKSGLEIEDYKNLDFSHFDEVGSYKIFMFHSGINEYKPKDMEKVDCLDKSLLPSGFDYYAGGHIHYRFSKDKIHFPGPIFPNNFKELCDLKYGSFNLVSDGEVETINLDLKDVVCIEIDVDGLSVEEANGLIKDKLIGDFTNKIVCLRVFGVLSSGKPSEISFDKIDCYCFLKNLNKLNSKEFEENDIQFDLGTVEEVEEKIIEDNKEQIDFDESVIKSLMENLSLEKLEGEKVTDFESRLLKGVLNVFK